MLIPKVSHSFHFHVLFALLYIFISICIQMQTEEEELIKGRKKLGENTHELDHRRCKWRLVVFGAVTWSLACSMRA